MRLWIQKINSYYVNFYPCGQRRDIHARSPHRRARPRNFAEGQPSCRGDAAHGLAGAGPIPRRLKHSPQFTPADPDIRASAAAKRGTGSDKPVRLRLTPVALPLQLLIEHRRALADGCRWLLTAESVHPRRRRGEGSVVECPAVFAR